MRKLRAAFPLLLSAGGGVAVGLGVLSGTLHYTGALVAAAVIVAFPFMGLLTAIACETWLSYVDVLWVPLRNYVIVLVAFSIMLVKFTRKTAKIQWDERARALKNIVATYLILILVINLPWGNTTKSEFISTMQYYVTRIAVGALIAYIIVVSCDSERKTLIAIDMVIVSIAVSAFVGVMQFFDVDFFWNLRYMLRVPDPRDTYYEALVYRQKISGLAVYSMPFSYQLVSVFPLALARILSQRKTVGKIAYGLLAAAIGFAIPMTQARSAILGAIAAMTAFLWRSKLQTKLIALFASGMILGIVLSQEQVQRRFSAEAERGRGTIPMIVMSIRMGLERPLGVPYNKRWALQQEFFSEVLDLEGAYVALDKTSHNQFLNALVYYGFPGLFLNISFYVVLFGMGHVLLKKRQAHEADITRAFIASFAGYVVHSSFHNPGPFIGGDVHSWYFIGLFVAFYLKMKEGIQNAAS